MRTRWPSSTRCWRVVLLAEIAPGRRTTTIKLKPEGRELDGMPRLWRSLELCFKEGLDQGKGRRQAGSSRDPEYELRTTATSGLDTSPSRTGELYDQREDPAPAVDSERGHRGPGAHQRPAGDDPRLPGDGNVSRELARGQASMLMMMEKVASRDMTGMNIQQASEMAAQMATETFHMAVDDEEDASPVSPGWDEVGNPNEQDLPTSFRNIAGQDG